MKKVFLFLVLTLILNGCCSVKKLDYSIQVPVNSETGKVDFTNTVQVDSTSQKELYSRAREWFAVTFVSSKAVLQMDDKDLGKLIGKGYSSFFILPEGKMYYVISVYLKDNKYKYSITDIKYEYNPPGTQTPIENAYPEDIITPNAFVKCPCIIAKARMKWRDTTIKEVNSICNSLNNAMRKKSKEW